jgi:hypothetical protein
MTPASTSPSRTADRMWWKGSTVTFSARSAGANKRTRRAAVVSGPGMAIVLCDRVSAANARRGRTAAAAQRGTTSQQAITFAQMAVGVERHLHHVRLAGQRGPVERFDVFQTLDDGRCTLDVTLDPRCEDERVVGQGEYAKVRGFTVISPPDVPDPCCFRCRSIQATRCLPQGAGPWSCSRAGCTSQGRR